MIHDILMPKLGLTMTEGSISEWKVAPGDVIQAGDVVLVIETDKVAHDVVHEFNGRVLEILVHDGETVAVGTALARVESTGPATQVQEAAAASINSIAATGPSSPRDPNRPVRRGATFGHRIIATPLARRYAGQAAVDLASISGSGPHGRIKAVDVQRAAVLSKMAVTPPARVVTEGRRRRPPSPLRAALARRMSDSKPGTPHFYLASEAEVSALEAARDAYNSIGDGRHLTLTNYIVAAVGRALADLPESNTVWADGELDTYTNVDVGIAVDVSHGLYAPVLRDVAAKSLEAVAYESKALVERARAGTLSTLDMTGAAITVSNTGMHNVTWMVPIIGPGQSATLGVASIRGVFRPDEDGLPVLRRELGMVLAADHRVFDGVSALALLNRIIHYLQSPQDLE